MSWSASHYLQFETERTRPVRDLVAGIANERVLSALDLGCGPGNSTAVLLERFPTASIAGWDSSSAMIEAARARLPTLDFEVATIESFAAASAYDVLLANASLQWLPDHAGLLPRLVAGLRPSGSLAVQMPDNLGEPAHVLMREVAAGAPWSRTLAHASQARPPLRSADWYYGLLRGHCACVDVWRTVYYHPLPGVEAVVEWFKSTGLRPYLAALAEVEQRVFLARYREALSRAYDAQADGTVLLPFPRLFIVARR